jgi:hypothetical protein
MANLSRWKVVSLAALLVSCGGGESVTSTAGPSAVPAVRAAAGSLSAPTRLQAANQMMDWAESQLPTIFPEHQATLPDIPAIAYRAYSNGIYLAVVTADIPEAGGVYVLGGPFSGLIRVGLVSDFPGITLPSSSAASCPAFTSGTYRLIKPAPIGQQNVVTLVSVVMDSSGRPKTALPGQPARALTAAAAPCSFTSPDGSGLAVSSAGVGMVSDVEGSNRFPALLFPEQTIPVSDLAGIWNHLSWARKDPGGFNQPYELNYGAVSLSPSGAVTGNVHCSVAVDLSGGCQTENPSAGFAVNPVGGYSGTGDLSGFRAFAYRNGTDTMIAGLDPDGSLTIFTPQAASALPAAGSSNTVLSMTETTAGVVVVAATNLIPGIGTVVNTNTSVDPATGVVIRTSVQDGGAPTTQTLRFNVPLAGFRKRDGGTNVSSSIFLPVRGMGLTAVSRLGATTATTPGTGTGFLNLSTDQP